MRLGEALGVQGGWVLQKKLQRQLAGQVQLWRKLKGQLVGHVRQVEQGEGLLQARAGLDWECPSARPGPRKPGATVLCGEHSNPGSTAPSCPIGFSEYHGVPV